LCVVWQDLLRGGIVLTASFNGKRVKVILERLDGMYVPHRDPEGTLYIGGATGPYNGLETAIHEAMHALWPRKTELEINRAACDMARFLWRLKYRRIE